MEGSTEGGREGVSWRRREGEMESRREREGGGREGGRERVGEGGREEKVVRKCWNHNMLHFHHHAFSAGLGSWKGRLVPCRRE